MKVVNPLKGKKQTPEHIAKRIASRFANGNYTGQIPWNKDIHTGHAPWFGKKRSLEDRQKMSRSRLARRERLGYINTPEAIKKVADALRGRPRPESHKARMREVMRGRVVRPPGWHHSDDTRKKLSVAKLGKHRPDLAGQNSPNWKGGITPLNHKIRHSVEYYQWRRAVFARDDYRCFDCGERGGDLQADHIFPFAFFPRLRFAVENGRTLCRECHKATPTYGVKVLVWQKRMQALAA